MNLDGLKALGLENDFVSAIKVPIGYEVEAFKDDNFQGDSLILKNNSSCLKDDNFNDTITSVQVRKASTFSLINEADSQCFGIENGGQNDGADAVSENCSGNESQALWFYPVAGKDNVYNIGLSHSGKCLGLDGGSEAGEGAQTQQWTCNGLLTQEWKLTPVAIGGVLVVDAPPLSTELLYKVVNQSSGLALGVGLRGLSIGDDVIIQSSYSGNTDQKWRLAIGEEAESSLPWSSVYTIVPSKHRMSPRDMVHSPNGKYRLTNQADGNVVLYDLTHTTAIWSTKTSTSNPGNLNMQADGNLVLYDGDSKALWASRTAGNSGAYLGIGNDGALIIYRQGGGIVKVLSNPVGDL